MADDGITFPAGFIILRSTYGEVKVVGTITVGRNYAEEVDSEGWRVLVPGLRWWRGHARVPGMLRDLPAVLGEECEVILSDGRTGRAFVTGYSEDSAWVIEIVGAGPLPSVPSSQEG
jgi:hypothetical protein